MFLQLFWHQGVPKAAPHPHPTPGPTPAPHALPNRDYIQKRSTLRLLRLHPDGVQLHPEGVHLGVSAQIIVKTLTSKLALQLRGVADIREDPCDHIQKRSTLRLLRLHPEGVRLHPEGVHLGVAAHIFVKTLASKFTAAWCSSAAIARSSWTSWQSHSGISTILTGRHAGTSAQRRRCCAEHAGSCSSAWASTRTCKTTTKTV